MQIIRRKIKFRKTRKKITVYGRKTQKIYNIYTCWYVQFLYIHVFVFVSVQNQNENKNSTLMFTLNFHWEYVIGNFLSLLVFVLLCKRRLETSSAFSCGVLLLLPPALLLLPYACVRPLCIAMTWAAIAASV